MSMTAGRTIITPALTEDEAYDILSKYSPPPGYEVTGAGVRSCDDGWEAVLELTYVWNMPQELAPYPGSEECWAWSRT